MWVAVGWLFVELCLRALPMSITPDKDTSPLNNEQNQPTHCYNYLKLIHLCCVFLPRKYPLLDHCFLHMQEEMMVKVMPKMPIMVKEVLRITTNQLKSISAFFYNEILGVSSVSVVVGVGAIVVVVICESLSSFLFKDSNSAKIILCSTAIVSKSMYAIVP